MKFIRVKYKTWYLYYSHLYTSKHTKIKMRELNNHLMVAWLNFHYSEWLICIKDYVHFMYAEVAPIFYIFSFLLNCFIYYKTVPVYRYVIRWFDCRQSSGIEMMYTISYQYFTTLGALVTIAVGLTASSIAGMENIHSLSLSYSDILQSHTLCLCLSYSPIYYVN